MSNLSSQELLARVDVLLAIIDAPDEEGVVFESEENPYDLVGSEGDVEACVQPWCGTEVEEEPKGNGVRIGTILVLVGAMVTTVFLTAWIYVKVQTFLALIGLFLWFAVHAL